MQKHVSGQIIPEILRTKKVICGKFIRLIYSRVKVGIIPYLRKFGQQIILVSVKFTSHKAIQEVEIDELEAKTILWSVTMCALSSTDSMFKFVLICSGYFLKTNLILEFRPIGKTRSFRRISVLFIRGGGDGQWWMEVHYITHLNH